MGFRGPGVEHDVLMRLADDARENVRPVPDLPLASTKVVAVGVDGWRSAWLHRLDTARGGSWVSSRP